MTIDFPPADPRGRELVLLVERAKYERWLTTEIARLLDREFTRVVDLMLSPGYRSLTRFQQQRTLQLFRELDRRIGAGYRDVTELVLREMRGYAQLEAEVARVQAHSVLALSGGTVDLSLAVTLPRSYLAAIAKLPIQGLRIGDWFDAQAATMSRETRRIIQQGLIEGKGNAEIARRILADQRAQGPVLSRRAASEAKAIGRTTVNAVQNDATMESYRQLPESVSDSYRWLSVHDNRTTLICIALDGRVWRYDDPQRRVPPAHVGCRSSTMPIIKGAEIGVGEQKTGPMNWRSYGDWLKAQSIGTQNEILGPTRAGFWRDGTMSLADSIDADNRVLTLPQLRAKLGLEQLATR